MFDSLTSRGYQVQFESHARAILGADFPSAIAELEAALASATIPIEEIVAGGGGEARGTQRLRRALAAKSWRKMNFKVEKRINDVPRESQSHEVDHVREFEVDGRIARIALEIEWNNKDPFFDRDLENFKRLHADGAISAGVIVTRGRSLHQNMRAMVGRFVDERQIRNLSDWSGRGALGLTAGFFQAAAARLHRPAEQRGKLGLDIGDMHPSRLDIRRERAQGCAEGSRRSGGGAGRGAEQRRQDRTGADNDGASDVAVGDAKRIA